MIRILLGCLCLCVSAVTAFAQQTDEADRRWFTVTLDPPWAAAEGMYVGGEMILHVQFISSDPFKRVRLDLPAIDGARTTVLTRARTRQVELLEPEGYSTLDSTKYSHETRLAIVPERSGSLVIPPIAVTGIAEPGDGRSFEFKKIYPEQTIVVHPEDPTFAGDTWIVARDVAIEEAWSHAISEIRTGDTVRRTVALRVAGVTADELPELVLDSAPGHRVLSTDIATRTETTEQGHVARMEQSWDIYIESEEITYISEIRFSYWNPEIAEPAEVTVASQRIEPLKRDAAALRETLRDEAHAQHEARRLGLWGLFAVPILALTIILVLTGWRALPTRPDWRFWRASGASAGPLEFYGSFLTWSRHTFGQRSVMRREQITPLGVRATDHVGRLHRATFGRSRGEIPMRSMATVLILAARRSVLSRFLSTLLPGIARFLFLR